MSTVRVAVFALVSLVLLAGCSAGRESEPENGSTDGSSGPEDGGRELVVEQIGEGQRGPGGPRLVVAGSAGELEDAAGVEVPDRGAGVYVCALSGERPTGGYRVRLSSGDEGSVRVTLQEPDRGDLVTQAITTPYAVAVVRGEGLEADDLSFVNASDEDLDWPVRQV